MLKMHNNLNGKLDLFTVTTYNDFKTSVEYEDVALDKGKFVCEILRMRANPACVSKSTWH
jgi:hypothetical protein